MEIRTICQRLSRHKEELINLTANDLGQSAYPGVGVGLLCSNLLEILIARLSERALDMPLAWRGLELAMVERAARALIAHVTDAMPDVGRAQLLIIRGALAEVMDEVRALQETAPCPEPGRSRETLAGLLATVSHELRSPLVSIQGYAELVLKEELGPLTSSQRKGMEVILRNIRMLVDMMENIILFAKLNSELNVIEFETIDLMDMIEDVVDLVEPQAREVKLQIHLAEVYPSPIIRGDYQKLHRMFRNLLDNAIKFNVAEGQVWVRIIPLEEEVGVQIQDSGVGIEEEFLPRIFEKFRKAGSNKARGSGIGLFLVKNILDLHNARIQVASRPGEGSCFSVFLPLRSHGWREEALAEAEME